MKKITFIFLATFIFIGTSTKAQNIGINPTGATPNASAMLDVSATDKGMLIPRISLTSTSDVTTIANPATSLLVYNTNAGMSNGSVGFYYWNGMVWVKINDGNASNSNGLWTANGNEIYNVNTGNVGIGIVTPSTPLQVSGAKMITLPNGSTETSNVTAMVHDTTPSTNASSKVGIYAMVRNHKGANVGVLSEATTKDSSNNFAILGNLLGGTQNGNLAYAIGAVDATPPSADPLSNKGALFISGNTRYTGVPNANEAGTIITNAGNGTMQWSKEIAFKATGTYANDSLNNSHSTGSNLFFEDYDNSNSYDVNTGKFTAPLSGKYHFDYLIPIARYLSNYFLKCFVQLGVITTGGSYTAPGSTILYNFYNPSHGLYTYSMNGGVDIQLNAGDQVYIIYGIEAGYLAVVPVSSHANFSGHLIR